MSKRRVDLASFKKALESGAAIPDAIIAKQFVSEVTKAEGQGDRVLEFTISTDDVDRAGDSVAVDGWDFASYLKNPVVLWCHNSGYDPSTAMPVAQALATWVEGGKLKSRSEFATRELYPFADTVYRMLLGGFLRAVSVGFIPKEWTIAEDRPGWMPMNFIRQELLEYSVVPVPANPNALLEAKAAGIELAPLVDWAEKVLDDASGPGLWVPRDSIEGIVKTLSTKTTVVVTAPIESSAKGSAAGEGSETSSAANTPEATDAVAATSPAAPVAAEAALDENPDEVTESIISKLEQHCDHAVQLATALKAGRVLSAANENRLRQARDLMSEVIAQVESQDDDADDKGVDQLEIETANEGADEEFIELDDEALETIKQSVRAAVDDQIRTFSGELV